MNLSPANVARLRALMRDGATVLQEVSDLREGLKETVKAVAEELDVKPAQINKLIKICYEGSMDEKREAFEELEELYKSSI